MDDNFGASESPEVVNVTTRAGRSDPPDEPGGLNDVALITSTWLRSFKDSAVVRGMRHSVYCRSQHALISYLLENSVVRVVCSESDPSVVLGWVCAQPTAEACIVHYVYVKTSFRRFGLATMLLEDLRERYGYPSPLPMIVTCRSGMLFRPDENGKRMIDKLREPNIEFNPYLLWMSLPAGWEVEGNQHALDTSIADRTRKAPGSTDPGVSIQRGEGQADPEVYRRRRPSARRGT